VLDYFGAGERNRTLDLLITSELLYQLSYTGFFVQTRIVKENAKPYFTTFKCGRFGFSGTSSGLTWA
jgi:hypothetical protein